MSEVHIASFIVRTKPGQFDAAHADLVAQLWISCPMMDAQQHKIIVVLEAPTTRLLDDQVQWLRDLAAVLSVTMVYHQVEQEHHLQQELIV